MNIQQLRYCQAVANHQSFGRAAKELYVSQSTLSTMIARLEEEIGITIFDRRVKPVEVTLEGRAIIRQINVVIGEINNLEITARQLKGELGGKLSIGIIPTVAPYLLPYFINAASARMPGTQIAISEMTTNEVVQALKARSLDMGILSVPLSEEDLIEYRLYTEPFYLYDGSNKMPKSKIDPLTLDCHRLWLMDEGHCLRAQVATVCDLRKRQNGERALEYKSGSIDTLMRFVKQNRGLTLLPHLATLDMSQQEAKKLRKFKEPTPSRAIGIVTHRHFKKQTSLKIISDEIKESISPMIPKKKKESIVSPIEA